MVAATGRARSSVVHQVPDPDCLTTDSTEVTDGTASTCLRPVPFPRTIVVPNREPPAAVLRRQEASRWRHRFPVSDCVPACTFAEPR
jgi:hypothetical protein